MAVTANKLIKQQAGCKQSYPAAGSTHFYQGCLSFINASGYIDDDTASGVNRFAGINVGEVDNSSGSNGDLNVEVLTDVAVELVGSGFSQASVGKDAYATDNYTVSAGIAANGVYCGRIVEYVSSTKVIVLLATAEQKAVLGVGQGYRIARGTATLDGSNPTTVDTGLTTIVTAVVSLKAASTPGDDPSWLSANYSGSDGNLDIYAYKNTGGTDPTLVASTNNSATIDWIAVGT